MRNLIIIFCTLLIAVIVSLFIYLKKTSVLKSFSQGVLVLNTDKFIYSPREKVNIGMSSLDKQGHTLCSSNLELKVTDPKNITSNINITKSPTCGNDNVTNDPDYFASFITGNPGKYILGLTNKDTEKHLDSSISVSEDIPFDIQRSGATRINPMESSRYPMVISVTANKNYKGTITESIPSSFDIVWQGSAKVTEKGDLKILTWNVSIKKGETQTFKYEYSGPKVSPEYFTLGPLNINGRDTGSVWQIASDATFQTESPRPTSYIFSNNNYSAILKNDSKNKIEIKIGEGSTKATNLVPKLKLSRWDDEVNLSVTLIDDHLNSSKTSIEGNQIVWTGETKEVRMYEVSDSEDAPGGGFEYNIILKQKPDSNKIEFTLNSKNLVFYYQPPLNEEPLEKGQTATETDVFDKSGSIITHRDENLVGSYAVYYDGHPKNVDGGKIYGNGKAFQIFRPKIQDSDGNWVWGNLNIDQKKGVLTVTIPQDFLDTAAYPISNAAGLLFGYNPSCTSGAASVVGSNTYAAQFATDSGAGGGSATSQTWCFSAETNGTYLKVALYSDSGAATATPSAVLTNGTSGGINTGKAYATVSFNSPYTLSASTTYWMAARADTTNSLIYYDTVTGHNAARSGTSYANFPLDPFGTGNGWYTNREFYVYTTYTAASTISVSGTIYQNDESTPYQCSTSGNLTVNLRVNGAGTYSTTCTADTGAWSISGITASSGNTIAAYISGGSVRGSTIVVSDDSNQTDVPIVQNRVTLRDDANGTITNTEIGTGDTSDSDDLISVSGGALTVSSSYETHVYTGDTFSPGGNVSTGKLHLIGNYSGNTETLTLTGTSGTLFTRSGTFTSGTGSTTVFNGATAPTALLSGTFTSSNSFYNLEMSPTIAGNISYSIGAAFDVSNNFTVNPTASSTYTLTVTLGGNSSVTGTTLLSGTTSGKSTLDTSSANNYTLSTGKLDIGAPGTLNANNTNSITINGGSGTILSQVGTFNAGGSTVLISGSGALSLTSATTFYNLSIAGTPTTSNDFTVNGVITVYEFGNLSPTGGTITMDTTNWGLWNSGTLDFYGLEIAETPTLQYSVNYKISDSLNVSSGKSLEAAGGTVTFDSGTTTISNSGILIFNNVAFNGSNSSNTSFSVKNNLSVGSSGNFSPAGGTVTMNNGSSINNSGTLTFINIVISGTVTTSSSFSVSGNWTSSGTFTASGGTVTLNGGDSTTQTVSGNSTFYNLTATTAANSAGRTVQHAGSSTTTVNGTWTMNGASGKILTLQSSNTSNWTITPANASIDYVYLSRSTNTEETICATHSTGDSNNSGYDFSSEDVCLGSEGNTQIKGLNLKGIIIE